MSQKLSEDGHIWLRNAISPDEVDQLRTLSNLGGKPGARVSRTNPLFEAIEALSFNRQIQAFWPNMKPVRMVSFDKNAESNWSVPWHQDRVIAVKKKADVSGYVNWSEKAGAWHCEPPESLFRQMLFVRLHLDRCAEENGAMEVALGSHKYGKVHADDAESVAGRCVKEFTGAAAGDVLILPMLTLHRSASAELLENRRVLRVDYASLNLPKPLEWAI